MNQDHVLATPVVDLKALANEDTLLPTQMFPLLPALATLVADTNFVSGTHKMSLILIFFCHHSNVFNLKATCRCCSFLEFNINSMGIFNCLLPV